MKVSQSIESIVFMPLYITGAGAESSSSSDNEDDMTKVIVLYGHGFDDSVLP